MALGASEWHALYTRTHKQPPTPTLGQAVLRIGRGGGHVSRSGDAMPGVKTPWRSWRDLEMLSEFYATLQNAYQRH